MPLIMDQDNNGFYYKFGNTGHKYYFNPQIASSVIISKQLALRQGRAIKSSQNKK